VIHRQLALVGFVLLACSPEANRTLDGGPGADIRNARWVTHPVVNPQAADTTLWPSRAPTPVERLAAGTMPLPK
jgi:hypothetical protein